MPAYTVPIVVENTGHMERSYDIYSRLLKDRIILLGTEIGVKVWIYKGEILDKEVEQNVSAQKS